MKPSDRALDIAVVGLGQAGGNLATEFSRLGYRAIALNTAHTDLSSLASVNRQHALTAEQRIYVGIDGYDGAGADLNYGRECIQENAERIRHAVSNHVDGADVVVLTAGLGGGTGSAVSELVRVLEELDLPLIVMATLPNEHESGIAKVNAVRAVSDLVKQRGIGWIFADNSRLAHIHGGVSLDKYFEKVNNVIIQPLDTLNRLNNDPGLTPIRTLDGEDFRTLLLSNGVINYADTVLSAFSVEAVTERVRENLQSSGMMPAGFSPEEVSYMGVILQASDEVLRGTPFSFYEQLNEQLKDETGGGAVYMGVYRMTNGPAGGAAILRMIASTQSLPEGVQAIVNDARREGGTLRDKLQRTMSTLDLGEIEDFDLFKTSTRTNHGQAHSRRRPNVESGLSVDDDLPQPPARKPKTAAPAPARAPVEPSPPAPPVVAAPAPSVGTDPSAAPPPAEASSDSSSSASDDSVDLSGVDPAIIENDPERKAEAASYSKLVSTFIRTDFDSTRKRVARRLQAARDSDDQVTRYLVESALNRLREEGQYDSFQAALGGDAAAAV